jgi:AAA15 family ATPase/GTPase
MECVVLEPDEIRVDAPDEITHDARQSMISSLSIKNFRCFKTVDLRDLGQFNFIVGDSGSGKTALIEALFLPGNGARVPLLYRGNRGMVTPEFSAVKQAYESLFSDLFFELSTKLPIEIKLIGDHGNLRKTEISFQPLTERPLLPESELKSDPITDKIFTFRTTDADNKQSLQQVNLKGGINIGGEHKEANIGFFSSVGGGSTQTLAQMLSDIRINNVKNINEKIEETMQKLFPQISILSPELTGGVPEIYCKHVGLTKKVPLSLVSNGISKVLAMLLFIATHENGVVLIDEIENGIYFRTLPNLVSVIIQFCKQLNVQIFASTHSREFLESLSPLIEKDEKDFRLIRMEDNNDGSHTARIFKGENFAAALETGTEIR